MVGADHGNTLEGNIEPSSLILNDDEVFYVSFYRLTAQPMKLPDAMVLVDDKVARLEIIE